MLEPPDAGIDRLLNAAGAERVECGLDLAGAEQTLQFLDFTRTEWQPAEVDGCGLAPIEQPVERVHDLA